MNRRIILLLVLSGIFFTACFSRNGLKNKKVIIYGSEEFKEFVANAKIKPKKAWKLQFAEYKKRFPNAKKNAAYSLHICIDDYYLFSDFFYMKTGHVSLSGYYVHSQTGEVILKKFDGKKYRYKKYRFRTKTGHNPYKHGYKGE